MDLHMYKQDEEKSLEVAEDEEIYDLNALLEKLNREMLEAAENLEFERAAALRDKIAELRRK